MLRTLFYRRSGWGAWLLALLLAWSATAAAGECAEIGKIARGALPDGAVEVIRKIERGERDFPFPGKDGSRFGNREGCLPAGGAYREYTVLDDSMKRQLAQGKRPNRGAQRIIHDQRNRIFYYTADHYRSFERVE